MTESLWTDVVRTTPALGVYLAECHEDLKDAFRAIRDDPQTPVGVRDQIAKALQRDTVREMSQWSQIFEK